MKGMKGIENRLIPLRPSALFLSTSWPFPAERMCVPLCWAPGVPRHTLSVCVRTCWLRACVCVIADSSTLSQSSATEEMPPLLPSNHGSPASKCNHGNQKLCCGHWQGPNPPHPHPTTHSPTWPPTLLPFPPILLLSSLCWPTQLYTLVPCRTFTQLDSLNQCLFPWFSQPLNFQLIVFTCKALDNIQRCLETLCTLKRKITWFLKSSKKPTCRQDPTWQPIHFHGVAHQPHIRRTLSHWHFLETFWILEKTFLKSFETIRKWLLVWSSSMKIYFKLRVRKKVFLSVI